MAGKLVALLIVLLIVLFVLFVAYQQYEKCKTGAGGVFSKLCHLLT